MLDWYRLALLITLLGQLSECHLLGGLARINESRLNDKDIQDAVKYATVKFNRDGNYPNWHKTTGLSNGFEQRSFICKTNVWIAPLHNTTSFGNCWSVGPSMDQMVAKYQTVIDLDLALGRDSNWLLDNITLVFNSNASIGDGKVVNVDQVNKIINDLTTNEISSYDVIFHETNCTGSVTQANLQSLKSQSCYTQPSERQRICRYTVQHLETGPNSKPDFTNGSIDQCTNLTYNIFSLWQLNEPVHAHKTIKQYYQPERSLAFDTIFTPTGVNKNQTDIEGFLKMTDQQSNANLNQTQVHEQQKCIFLVNNVDERYQYVSIMKCRAIPQDVDPVSEAVNYTVVDSTKFKTLLSSVEGEFNNLLNNSNQHTLSQVYNVRRQWVTCHVQASSMINSSSSPIIKLSDCFQSTLVQTERRGHEVSGILNNGLSAERNLPALVDQAIERLRIQTNHSYVAADVTNVMKISADEPILTFKLFARSEEDAKILKICEVVITRSAVNRVEVFNCKNQRDTVPAETAVVGTPRNINESQLHDSTFIQLIDRVITQFKSESWSRQFTEPFAISPPKVQGIEKQFKLYSEYHGLKRKRNTGTGREKNRNIYKVLPINQTDVAYASYNFTLTMVRTNHSQSNLTYSLSTALRTTDYSTIIKCRVRLDQWDSSSGRLFFRKCYEITPVWTTDGGPTDEKAAQVDREEKNFVQQDDVTELTNQAIDLLNVHTGGQLRYLKDKIGKVKSQNNVGLFKSFNLYVKPAGSEYTSNSTSCQHTVESFPRYCPIKCQVKAWYRPWLNASQAIELSNCQVVLIKEEEGEIGGTLGITKLDNTSLLQTNLAKLVRLFNSRLGRTDTGKEVNYKIENVHDVKEQVCFTNFHAYPSTQTVAAGSLTTFNLTLLPDFASIKEAGSHHLPYYHCTGSIGLNRSTTLELKNCHSIVKMASLVRTVQSPPIVKQVEPECRHSQIGRVKNRSLELFNWMRKDDSYVYEIEQFREGLEQGENLDARNYVAVFKPITSLKESHRKYPPLWHLPKYRCDVKAAGLSLSNAREQISLSNCRRISTFHTNRPGIKPLHQTETLCPYFNGLLNILTRLYDPSSSTIYDVDRIENSLVKETPEGDRIVDFDLTLKPIGCDRTKVATSSTQCEDWSIKDLVKCKAEISHMSAPGPLYKLTNCHHAWHAMPRREMTNSELDSSRVRQAIDKAVEMFNSKVDSPYLFKLDEIEDGSIERSDSELVQLELKMVATTCMKCKDGAKLSNGQAYPKLIPEIESECHFNVTRQQNGDQAFSINCEPLEFEDED